LAGTGGAGTCGMPSGEATEPGNGPPGSELADVVVDEATDLAGEAARPAGNGSHGAGSPVAGRFSKAGAGACGLAMPHGAAMVSVSAAWSSFSQYQ
jgi:hypothetical protein